LHIQAQRKVRALALEMRNWSLKCLLLWMRFGTEGGLKKMKVKEFAQMNNMKILSGSGNCDKNITGVYIGDF
jgi:hypothetical protein